MAKPTTKYIETTAIGGPGGVVFKILKEGQVVKKMQFWWDDHCLRGLEVTLSDGSIQSAGRKEGDDKLLELGLTEEISHLHIYRVKMHAGVRCGGLRLKTSAGKESEVGPLKGTHSQLNGGKAAGLFGGSGADIDRLGFIYTNEVSHYELKNVSYDLSKLDDKKLIPSVVARGVYINQDEQRSSSFDFSAERSVEKTSSWSSSFSITLGVKASGSAGVPLLAKGTWEISAELSFSYTWGGAVAENEGFAFAASGEIPPRMKVVCEGILRKGYIDVPYKGTAVLHYQNGDKLEEPESGVYQGVGAYDSQVKIRPAEPLTPDELNVLKSQDLLVIDAEEGKALLEELVVVA